MAEIAVDFMLGTAWYSRLIGWFGGGDDYSHCASVLADGRYLDAYESSVVRVDPLCDVPEVVPAGVHIRDPKSETWVRKRRLTLEITQDEYEDWEEGLRAKIGDRYARSDLWSFIVGRPIPQHPGEWDCSALVINELQHIKKVPYPLPVAAHGISPNAALLILATAGFKVGLEETRLCY